MIDLLFPRASGPITSSEQLFREVYGGRESSTGISVTDESAMRVSAVFACISLRAEARAHLPFGVFKKRPEGGRDELLDDDLVRLLNKPNPWQTRMGFLELRSIWLDLRGNFYALKIRLGGKVEELIPLNPTWVTWKLLPGAERVYTITPPAELGLGHRTVSQEDMLHHVAMPRSAWEGRGILTAAREAVGMSIAAEQHGAKVFKNGTRLSGVLQSKDAVPDEARTRIKQSWDETYSGSDNAWKVAVLEAGLEWKETGMTAEDAQWIESRRFQVEDIARFFRVPLHLIGETSKATSWGSGIAQLSTGFVVWTLVPILVRDEQQFDRDFLSAPSPGGQRYCKWNVSGLLRGDPKSQAEALRIERQEAVLSGDEWRELNDRNPIPDGSGKIFLRMANTTRLDGPDKMSADGPGAPGSGAAPASNEPKDEQDAA